jgi:hypothetical protein
MLIGLLQQLYALQAGARAHSAGADGPCRFMVYQPSLQQAAERLRHPSMAVEAAAVATTGTATLTRYLLGRAEPVCLAICLRAFLALGLRKFTGLCECCASLCGGPAGGRRIAAAHRPPDTSTVFSDKCITLTSGL